MLLLIIVYLLPQFWLALLCFQTTTMYFIEKFALRKNPKAYN